MTRSHLTALLSLCTAFFGGSAPVAEAASVSPVPKASPIPGQCIAVVGTNDLHGAIEPYVVAQYGAEVRSGGVIGLSGYVANLRGRYGAGMVLVDGGDLFQGTLASNMSHGRAVVDAYNHMAYTAAAVGNHEFDYGAPDNGNDRLGILKDRIAQAEFPFLTLNIFERATGERVSWANTAPSILRDVNGVRVGILGISTPETPRVTKPINVESLIFKDPVPLIRAEAAALRQQGAQLVIMVGHVGGHCRNLDDPNDAASCNVAGDMELVDILNALPPKTVDVAVGGHTHQFMAHWINGTATIESGARGHYVGWVEACVAPEGGIDAAASTIHGATALCLDTWSDGGCKKRRLKVPPLPVRPARFLDLPVAPSADLQKAMQPYLDAVRAKADKPVGVHLPRPLDARTLTDLAAESMRRMVRADFAMQNSGGIRTGLPAGDITFGQAFEVMPFDNAVILANLTGEQVTRLILLLMRRPGHGGSFLALAGLRTERRGNALVVLDGKGRALQPERRYTMALSDFVVQGGEGAGAVFKDVPDADKVDTGASVLDSIIAQLHNLYPSTPAKPTRELAPEGQGR